MVPLRKKVLKHGTPKPSLWVKGQILTLNRLAFAAGSLPGCFVYVHTPT